MTYVWTCWLCGEQIMSRPGETWKDFITRVFNDHLSQHLAAGEGVSLPDALAGVWMIPAPWALLSRPGRGWCSVENAPLFVAYPAILER